MALVSIVVPVFNERRHIAEVIDRVRALPIAKEVIVVDDFSTDGTREILAQLEATHAGSLDPSGNLAPGPVSLNRIRVVYHPRNRGKGAALRTGFEHVSGDVVCIQDADLEYHPSELLPLIEAVRNGVAECAFGSRFLGGAGGEGYLANRIANWFLTKLSNWTTGLQLTDMETCYKVIRADILRSIRLEEDRFGFEPEVTAKLAGRGTRVKEFPISYTARKHSEGKKIGMKDGLRAIYCILKYSRIFQSRRATAPL